MIQFIGHRGEIYRMRLVEVRLRESLVLGLESAADADPLTGKPKNPVVAMSSRPWSLPS